jgi:outer membrane protein OmpA-like peptidoglycan-associated protein
VGNGVKAGKLAVAIKYDIVARRLDSKTKLTLKDFEWGEATNSPDATKLPVKTAFKVLRDRSGRIVFDVQVQGDLDDPTFRLDQVVVKQFKDLILRIATSPFALLGIGGGGEDLTFVEFAAGSHSLAESEQKKLDVLAKELFDHPDLKMQIEGSVDSTTDKGVSRLPAVESV